MTKEQRTQIAIKTFANNLREGIAYEIHVARIQVMWRVLAPIMLVPVLACLVPLVLDGLSLIPPIRGELLTALAAIVGGTAITSAIGTGFGWLYKIPPED